MAFTKRGGRKLVISPDGVSTVASTRPRVDNTMVKALARAFRWRKLLETGVYATVEEIAAAEKINASYVRRVLRLTLLAPDIVEAIMDGRQPTEMTLGVLMRPLGGVGRSEIWLVAELERVSRSGLILIKSSLFRSCTIFQVSGGFQSGRTYSLLG